MDSVTKGQWLVNKRTGVLWMVEAVHVANIELSSYPLTSMRFTRVAKTAVLKKYRQAESEDWLRERAKRPHILDNHAPSTGHRQ